MSQMPSKTMSNALMPQWGRMLAKQGRGGDTMLAHISRAEAQLLHSRGGAWSINPKTGLPEFMAGGGSGSSGGGDSSAGGSAGDKGGSDRASGSDGGAQSGGSASDKGGSERASGGSAQGGAGGDVIGGMQKNQTDAATGPLGGVIGREANPGTARMMPHDFAGAVFNALSPFGLSVHSVYGTEGVPAHTNLGLNLGGLIGSAAGLATGIPGLGTLGDLGYSALGFKDLGLGSWATGNPSAGNFGSPGSSTPAPGGPGAINVGGAGVGGSYGQQRGGADLRNWAAALYGIHPEQAQMAPWRMAA